MWLIALIIFVLVLRSSGRLGPFLWDPAGAPRGWAAPADSRPHGFVRSDPESVLAMRLADGEITPAEYLERLSLLRES